MNINISAELRTEIGNTIAAYSVFLHKASMGISTPGFEPLMKCSETELRHKLEILKDFYNQL